MAEKQKRPRKKAGTAKLVAKPGAEKLEAAPNVPAPNPLEEQQPSEHESSEESSVERIRRGHEDRSRSRRKTLKHRSRASFTTGIETEVDKDQLIFHRVVRSEGAHFICQSQDGTLRKARTYRGTQTENPNSSLVAVGDRVALETQAEGDDVVFFIEKRKTKLSRRAAGRKDNFEQVVVANVDLLIIVGSIYDPPLSPGIIDRYIVAGLQGGLEILIAINKIDIAGAPSEQAVIEEFVNLYRSLGYGSIGVSATDGNGIDELRSAIWGKISVFAGHSGVGKSSLVNALLGTDREKIGDLQRKFNRGAHTTSSSVLREVPGIEGTFVVDTPGVREFANFELDSENLKFSFVEFLPFQQLCKITNCTHLHEPGCAVLEAVEGDKIHVERYSSYAKLYDEAKKDEKKQLHKD